MRMEAGLSASLDQKVVIKTAFVSYYISMYNSVSRGIGFEDSAVTADEIYDFIQDLKHETGKRIPDVTRDDVKFCFHLLHLSGICKN